MAILVEFIDGGAMRHSLGVLTTLGRAGDNSIQLNHATVSAYHATIKRLPDGAYLLQDLGTTNGTFIDAIKVEKQELSEGDKITLGGVSLCFSERVSTRAKTAKLEESKASAFGTGAGIGFGHGSGSGRFEPSKTILHSVKMTVSEELSALRPAWKKSAEEDYDSTLANQSSGNLQQDYDRLQAGYQIIHAIVGEDNLDAILNKIVDSVIELMAVDRAAVLLLSPEGELVPHVALQKRKSREEFKVSTSILKHVCEHHSAVICNDIEADARFSHSKSIIMSNVRSAMCVPMLHEGQLVGVLHMDSLIIKNTFNEESAEVVRAIANTAAYAVRTAMLKEQILDMERQKTEAMRAMISGASHFINNPLAVIQANLSMFQEWSETLTKFHKSLEADPTSFSEMRETQGIDFIDEELAPMAQETNQAAARIGAIVTALHIFEHQDDPEAWTQFDAADLVEEVMAAQSKSIDAVAKAHLQLSPAPIRGVRERLQLLLRALVVNAWQSIDGGGRDKNWVVASCHVVDRRVLITIDDTGRGIPSERQHRVFAPFETERLDGSLGLGLALAAEVASQHQALLKVSAREGGGTRLTLSLPLAI